MGPVIVFSGYKQAMRYLREWQSRLNLDDWIIDLYLEYDQLLTAPDWGRSSNFRAIRVAEIYIPMPAPGQINRFPERYCQEEILVHELLHVRMPSTRVDPSTNEGNFYRDESHAILEHICKALIKAKYGIDQEWFYNF